jgi:hypothetical protein
MKNKRIEAFFTALVCAFAISVLVITFIYTFASNTKVVAVSIIWQAFGVSILCSVINLVYLSEKLTFIKQSIIAYVLISCTLLILGRLFNWYTFEKPMDIFITFCIFSALYLPGWICIRQINKTKEKKLNEKLQKFKNDYDPR